MNGFCNSENVVYQGIIHPKENVKDTNKDLYRDLFDEMEAKVQ